MHDLIKSSIEAHGGLARWNQIRQISANFAAGGPAFEQRGQEAFTQMPMRVTVDTRQQKTIFSPFFPTKRRVYLRGPERLPQKDLAIISADLSDFNLSRPGP